MIASYDALLARNPKDAFVLSRRAAANKAEGKQDAALADAASALAINPKLVELYLLRANIFRAQRKTDLALGELHDAEGR